MPARAPFDLWQREAARGLKLYVRRVFIMDDAEQFLPLYLRFIKGVVDSNDLPLNVSRELLQQDREVEAMRAALTRRALEMLAKLAKDEPEKYAAVLARIRPRAQGRPGRGSGQSRAAAAAAALCQHRQRRRTRRRVSLADYVARMRPGQERIYYIVAESTRQRARDSPHLELLRQKGVEVLLMADRVDEWVMGRVSEFEGKRFKDVARGDLELGGLAEQAERARIDEERKEHKALLKRFKDALGRPGAGSARQRAAARLAACLVRGEGELSAQMRRVLAANGQAHAGQASRSLELNVAHPLVRHMDGLAGLRMTFQELALLLYDQASSGRRGPGGEPGGFQRAG